jgi:hypothetical protein
MMAVSLVLALGLFGCGGDDDDDDAAASASASTASEDEGGEGGEGDLATYCEKSAEIEILLSPGPDIDFESASPEEITEAMKAFASTGTEIADEALAVAPEEIRADIERLVGSLHEVAETGDPSAFENEENEAASANAHAFDLENCGWNVVDVTATDYAFAGIPDELEAGVTSFELANDGTELHELIVLRKNDDTTESFDELLALPQEEAETKVTPVGAAFSTPGEEGVYAVADLTAGEYMAICFIPVGLVDEEAQADGPPHFTQGMLHQFTVA